MSDHERCPDARAEITRLVRAVRASSDADPERLRELVRDLADLISTVPPDASYWTDVLDVLADRADADVEEGE